MKYTESEYQKEYNEIIEVYEEQMKPLRIPWLIAFIVVTTIISTSIFFNLLDAVPFWIWFKYGIRSTGSGVAGFAYFIPGTYFIRLRQVKRHKKRRLQNLEDKKMEAVSSGNFDANA